MWSSIPMRRRILASVGIFTTAAAMPFIYTNLSDSQSSFYRYAIAVGKVVLGRDAELAHRAAVLAAKYSIVPQDRIGNDKSLACTVWGIPFPNAIALAAGFDKHGECMSAMLTGSGLGFGFVEVGSVTPLPQPGNPAPRVFRLLRDKAVINRYGFNSEGVEAVARRLSDYRGREHSVDVSTSSATTDKKEARGVVGVNLGRNKDSSDAAEDYVRGVRALAQFADYLVVNVSCPNLTGLRALQGKQQLRALLLAVKSELAAVVAHPDYHSRCSGNVGSYGDKYRPPLLVKISPDLTDAELAEVAAVVLEVGIDGVVVSNTTAGGREGLLESSLAQEAGGLSGRPLLSASNHALSSMYRLTGGRVPLIGVGGVSSAEDAYQKIRLGASLVQLYSALVFEGPGLPATIKQELPVLLRRDGFSCVQEAVGAAHRQPQTQPVHSLVPRDNQQ